jgi:amidase
MARSAADLKLAMKIIAGPMPLQQPGWQLSLPAPRANRLGDLRVAIWANDDAAPVDDEIAQRALDIGTRLEKLGATVSMAARPDIDLQAAQISYLYLMQAVNNAGAPEPVYRQNLEIAKSFAADDMSMDALFARAAVQSHHEWSGHRATQTAARFAWKAFFEDWDVLICPISTTTAFKHDHAPFGERTLLVNGKPRPYFEGSFWAGLISLPGLPSTVFPTGLSHAGLPIGLQAVCGEYHDFTCIEFAHLIAREIGGFVPPDNYA